VSCLRLLLLITFYIVIAHPSDLPTIEYDFLAMRLSLLDLLVPFVKIDLQLHRVLLTNHGIQALPEIVRLVHGHPCTIVTQALLRLIRLAGLIHGHVLDLRCPHELRSLGAPVKGPRRRCNLLGSTLEGPALYQFSDEAISPFLDLLRALVNG